MTEEPDMSDQPATLTLTLTPQERARVLAVLAEERTSADSQIPGERHLYAVREETR